MNTLTWTARREQVAKLAPGALLIVPGARDIPMNIPMNHAPFRQTSHMLYLCGVTAPEAALIGDSDSGHWELFLRTPPPGDEIWHGKTPSPQQLAAGCGVNAVYDIDALEERVGALRQGRPVYALPAPDPVWLERLKAMGVSGAGLNGQVPREDEHPLADALIRLRNIKDEAEIAQLQQAADITAQVHHLVMAAVQPGLTTEAQLKALVEGCFTAAGGRPAYSPIITTRGDILHQRAGTATVQDGELLLVDVGVEMPTGYCADVTRTFPVNGRFSARQRAIYEVVLAAQLKAIAACVPGVRYKELHLKTAVWLAEGLIELGVLKGDAEECVQRDAHALFFPHGLGHLLGMDVHDLEDLGDRAGYALGWQREQRFGLAWLRMDRVLEPGVVVTIEPGIYFIEALLQDPEVEARNRTNVNFDEARKYLGLGGVRIEDDVLVTAHGNRVLTAACIKSVDEVEAMVGSDPTLLGALYRWPQRQRRPTDVH